MKVKSIMPIATGTQITVEDANGNTHIGKTFWDHDGIDKVELDGKLYEYTGGFNIKPATYDGRKHD